MSEKVDRIKGITQEVLECIHSGATDMDALALALGHAKGVISHATQRLKRRGFITAETPGKYSVTEEGLRWITSGVSIKPGQSLKKRRKTRGLRARAWWRASTLPGVPAAANRSCSTGPSPISA